jgi:hypothetical protein
MTCQEVVFEVQKDMRLRVPMSQPRREDMLVFRVNIEGEIQTLHLPIDPGVTEEKRQSMAKLCNLAARPASRLIASQEGLRFEWDDGRAVVFTPWAWKEGWAGRPPVEGARAINAVMQYEAYLYGVVIGPQLDQEIAQGRISLWEALRDFAGVAQYSPLIQVRIRAAFEAARDIRQKRGERSADYQNSVIERWLTTVSRVEEFHRQGNSYEEAFAKVAECEGRAGADPAAVVRGEYKRGRKWQKLFGRSRVTRR